jgi:hypothetical protein
MSLQNPLHLLLLFWWVIALALVIAHYRLILRLFGVVPPRPSIPSGDSLHAAVSLLLGSAGPIYALFLNR